MANITQANEELLKVLHIEIPKDLHSITKTEAFLKGLTLRDYVVEVLQGAAAGNSQHSKRPEKSTSR
jgi:hypothetical protein